LDPPGEPLSESQFVGDEGGGRPALRHWTKRWFFSRSSR
jgi:hypothetical protein